MIAVQAWVSSPWCPHPSGTRRRPCQHAGDGTLCIRRPDPLAGCPTSGSPPRRSAELVIPSDEIPADPAAAADFCAEQDEALHRRGLMRTGPWQELPSGLWTTTIAAA